MVLRSAPSLHCLTRAKAGISLMEVAILLVLMSAAFVPIALTLGGQTPTNTAGTVNTLNEQGMQKLSAANSLLERAVTGQVIAQNINSMADVLAPTQTVTSSMIPLGGSSTVGPFTYQLDNGEALTYRWLFQDMSYITAPGGELQRVSPKGNRIVRATLETQSSESGSANNNQTMNSYLYFSEPLAIAPDPWVGVSLVADVSGSMCDSERYNLYNQRSKNGLCHPFLADRFDRTDPFPNGALPTSMLELFDDRNLDIGFSRPVDDPTTPYQDNFMQRTILGMPPASEKDVNCSIAMGVHPHIAWLFWDMDDGSWPGGHSWWDWRDRDMLYALCRDGSWQTTEQWLKNINPYISRFEALRGALLAFLVKLERDEELVSSMSMGLTTFSTTAKAEVPMGGPVTTIYDPETKRNRPRFKSMRERIAFINRYDKRQNWARTIKAEGYTNWEEALINGAKAFDNDARINSKHLIIVSDGEPTVGNTNREYLKQLGKAISYHCRDASGNYPATPAGPTAQCSTDSNDFVKINIVGFAGIPEADQKFMKELAELGQGRYLQANNADELQAALFTLSHDIKKSMLMKRVERYNAEMASLL